MIQKFALTVLLLCFSTAAFADGPIVRIPYAPALGSKWTIVETNTVTGGTQEEQVEPTSSTVRGTLTIEGATSTGYEATWTTDEAHGNATPTNAIAWMLPELTFRLILSRAGRPADLSNWDVIRGQFLGVLPSDDSTAIFRRLLEGWNSSIAADAFFKSLSFIAICQGVSLRVGEPLLRESTAANAFGGTPLATHSSLELQQVDEAAGVGRLVYSRTFDPEALGQSLTDGVSGLTGQSMPDGAHIQMSMQDTITCETDLSTGVVRRAMIETQTGVGPAQVTIRREVVISPQTS